MQWLSLIWAHFFKRTSWKAPSLFQNNKVHSSNLDKVFLCHFFRLGCWIWDPRRRLDQHPAERGPYKIERSTVQSLCYVCSIPVHKVIFEAMQLSFTQLNESFWSNTANRFWQLLTASFLSAAFLPLPRPVSIVSCLFLPGQEDWEWKNSYFILINKQDWVGQWLAFSSFD